MVQKTGTGTAVMKGLVTLSEPKTMTIVAISKIRTIKNVVAVILVRRGRSYFPRHVMLYVTYDRKTNKLSVNTGGTYLFRKIVASKLVAEGRISAAAAVTSLYTSAGKVTFATGGIATPYGVVITGERARKISKEVRRVLTAEKILEHVWDYTVLSVGPDEVDPRPLRRVVKEGKDTLRSMSTKDMAAIALALWYLPENLRITKDGIIVAYDLPLKDILSAFPQMRDVDVWSSDVIQSVFEKAASYVRDVYGLDAGIRTDSVKGDVFFVRKPTSNEKGLEITLTIKRDSEWLGVPSLYEVVSRSLSVEELILNSVYMGLLRDNGKELILEGVMENAVVEAVAKGLGCSVRGNVALCRKDIAMKKATEKNLEKILHEHGVLAEANGKVIIDTDFLKTLFSRVPPKKFFTRLKGFALRLTQYGKLREYIRSVITTYVLSEFAEGEVVGATIDSENGRITLDDEVVIVLRKPAQLAVYAYTHREPDGERWRRTVLLVPSRLDVVDLPLFHQLLIALLLRNYDQVSRSVTEVDIGHGVILKGRDAGKVLEIVGLLSPRIATPRYDAFFFFDEDRTDIISDTEKVRVVGRAVASTVPGFRPPEGFLKIREVNGTLWLGELSARELTLGGVNVVPALAIQFKERILREVRAVADAVGTSPEFDPFELGGHVRGPISTLDDIIGATKAQILSRVLPDDRVRVLYAPPNNFVVMLLDSLYNMNLFVINAISAGCRLMKSRELRCSEESIIEFVKRVKANNYALVTLTDEERKKNIRFLLGEEVYEKIVSAPPNKIVLGDEFWEIDNIEPSVIDYLAATDPMLKEKIKKVLEARELLKQIIEENEKRRHGWW